MLTLNKQNKCPVVAEMGNLWPQQTLAEKWWGCAPFLGAVSSVPIYNVAWAEAYLHTKWHLSPASRLATTDIGRKLGDVPFRGGELGPI